MTRRTEPPAAQLIARLAADRVTLATAESLTGGLIGAALTAVPGASQVYLGGVIAYATAMKTRFCGVPVELLDQHGAVSAQTVGAMAQGVRRRTGADWAIAVSGVAGPAEQEGHPPGTVWVAVADARTSRSQRFDFAGDRAEIRDRTVAAALGLLLAALDER